MRRGSCEEHARESAWGRFVFYRVVRKRGRAVIPEKCPTLPPSLPPALPPPALRRAPRRWCGTHVSYVISARSEINLARFRFFNRSLLIALSTRAITGRVMADQKIIRKSGITHYVVRPCNRFLFDL